MARKQVLRRRFGSIRQRKGRWFIEFTGPDGKRHSAGRSFATEKQAELWASKEEQHIDACRLGYELWMPPRDRLKQQQVKRVTVAEYLEQFQQRLLDHGDVRLSTYQQYVKQVDNRIIREDVVTGDAALLRALPLAAVTKADVQAWWDALMVQFPDTPEANRKAYVRLRAAFNDAVERDLISANPVAIKAAVKSSPRKHERPLLEDGELAALLEAAPARYKALTVLVFFHGLRIGEAIGLERGNIILGASPIGPGPWLPTVTVQVRGQFQRLVDDQGKTYLNRQPTKTTAGIRDVPLFEEFATIIIRHLVKFAEPGAGGLLTITSRGNAVFDTSYRKTLEGMRERAGISSRVHPHAGRRWITTRLAEAGATPAEIGQILGDKDLSTIMHTYTQVRQSRPRELMGKIGHTLTKGQGA